MATSHAARLQDWLKRNQINPGSHTRWLFEVPDTGEAPTAVLTLLNEVQSRFDDVSGAQEGEGFLDWDKVREELSLLPDPSSPWNRLLDSLREGFVAQGYPGARCQRAERL